MSISFYKKIFSYSGVIIWHAHRNNEILYACILRLFIPLKLVVTRHSDTEPSVITRMLYKRADKVVTINPNMERYFDYGVEYVPHSIDIARYKYVSSEYRSGELIGIKQKYIVGVVGRVREEKGQAILIKAISPILINNPEWAVVILGKVKASDSKYHTGMLEYAEKQGVLEQIYFHDEVEDPRPHYESFSILAVPSLSEGFSMVTLEGMASGCAVICFRDVGIHNSLISDERDGLLIPYMDVELFTQKLKLLISDGMFRKRMGICAREKVLAEWSIETEVNHLVRIYEGLTKSSKKSSQDSNHTKKSP